MDIVEAVQQRKSIRAFKSDAVPKEVIRELMEVALRAPSWGNTQPWDFIIAAGPKLEEIRETYARIWNEAPRGDLARPQGFPEPYNSRRQAQGKREVEAIQTRETQGEDRRRVLGSHLYGAPCVIFICTGRDFYVQGNNLNVWPVFDCGLVAENIMLLAVKFGLGTLPAIQLVKYPDVLRKVLAVPESKLFVLGIAIGYPDDDYPLNRVYSSREQLEKVISWQGFD